MQIDGYSLDAQKTKMKAYDENGYLMMGVKEFLLDANSLHVRLSRLIQQLNNRNVKKNIAKFKQHGGLFCHFPIHSCRKEQ